MKLSMRVEGQPRRMRSKLSEACALCEADLVLFLLKRRNSVVTRVHAHSRLAPSLVQRLSFDLVSCGPPERTAVGRCLAPVRRARASPAFRIVVTRTLPNPCQGVQ